MLMPQVGNQIGKFGFVGGPAVPPTDVFVTAEIVVGTKSRLSVKGFHDFVNQVTSDVIFEAGTGRFRNVNAFTNLQIPVLSQRVDVNGNVILRVKVILTSRTSGKIDY